MKVTFTPSEVIILAHRSECCDCLADACQESTGLSYEQVEQLARELDRAFRLTGVLDSDMTDNEKEIVGDWVDGSTFFCGMEDAVATKQWTRGQALAAHKAAKSIESKFEQLGIKTTGFPKA